MNALMIMFHCEMDAGYAIDSLLDVFLEMAAKLVPETCNIHLSFTKLAANKSEKQINKNIKIIEFDPALEDKNKFIFIKEYIKENNIDVIFGFDQPVSRHSYRYMRAGGVKFFVSYCGAPTSSINSGLKVVIKRIEVMLRRYSPDHYIYESKAMAMTAYNGRGIQKNKVSIVYLGVDTDTYKPSTDKTFYAHQQFNIPNERKIIYYSGHMEKRKGVDVLIKAAKYLSEHVGRTDFHFLILGNRSGEEKNFLKLLGESKAKHHVTFGGYRKDINKILPSCYLGAIASTGWDSFTMSSLEIASCGIPLLVSNLQGLVETIDEGKTGLLFDTGDYEQLAGHIRILLDDEEKRNLMGAEARKRILLSFSKRRQVENLVCLMNKLSCGT